MLKPAATTSASRAPVIAAIGCAAAGAILFHCFGNAARGYVDTSSLFWWWISQWLDPRAESEHGWLILGASAWLLWRNLRIADGGSRMADSAEPEQAKPETGYRKRENAGPRSETTLEQRRVASESPVSGSRSPVSSARFPVAALAAMLAGLGLHFVGFVAQQARVSILGFLVFTWGVLRLGGGRRWGDAAMFPLAFLVLAIPVSMLDELGLPLRLWVTDAGERFAHALGIEVIRSGTQLIAPDGRYHYDVAAPCSGVRSLVALTALSVLLGYIQFNTASRRALVFAACFPLVYAGNVVRIAAIILAANAGGEAWGTRVHEVMGYGVFVIVFAGMLGWIAVIRRSWPERPAPVEKAARTNDQTATGAAGQAGKPTPLGSAGTTTGASGGLAAIVIAAAVVEMFALGRLSRLPPRGGAGVALADDGTNPVELPAFLGTDWIGQRVEVTAIERDLLPEDTGYSRKNYAFVADRKRDVFLSIVLSGRDRTSIHRPELCLVGQGWTIEGAARHRFRHPGAGDGFPATLLRVRRELPGSGGKRGVPQLVAYWFVSADAIVASHWDRFVHDAWNRVARQRVDRWAYVLMQTDATDGEAAAVARMQSILDETLPSFQPLSGG